MNMTRKIKAGLVVECGSMFSGKSDAIRRRGNRYGYSGHSVVFVKPDLDNRYDEFFVTTHNGDKVPAINTDIHQSILKIPDVVNADVVLIDEVQFFNNQIIEDIQELIDMGKKIYVAGLDLDFKGNPFPITQHLMSVADKVVKHKAVCMSCGEDAYISHKKVKNDKIVELGHSDLYEALCRTCYKKKNA